MKNTLFRFFVVAMLGAITLVIILFIQQNGDPDNRLGEIAIATIGAIIAITLGTIGRWWYINNKDDEDDNYGH